MSNRKEANLTHFEIVDVEAQIVNCDNLNLVK